MEYTTYEFYKEKYYGELVTDAGTFSKLLDKAQDKIDLFTRDRLVNGLPTDDRANIKVQKAVCALIDKIFEISERKKKADNTDGIVKGKSDGTESITYALSDIDIALSSVNTESALNRILYKVATEYLMYVPDDKGVNLLYWGI